MKDYTSIVNSYMKFFCCRLLEYSGIEDSGFYFGSIYSYLKNYDNNMREVVYELHMPNLYSKNTVDIIVFLNAAIDYLRRKMRKKLLEMDTKERKEIFYIVAAFQAEFHGRINLVKDGLDLDIGGAHYLEQNILQLVKNKIYVHEIRGICAIDKNAIQLIMQECLKTEQLKTDCREYPISIESFCDVYGCALTIIELMSKRSFLQMKMFDSPAIQIDNGNLKFRGTLEYNTEQYVDKFETDMMKYVVSFPKSIKEILDNNFYKTYGFKIDMVCKIASSQPTWLSSEHLATESNYATIVGEFVQTLRCTREEAERIFSYLCIDECKMVGNCDFPEKDENRIFEKCILKIDKDRYLYSQILLGCAYLILERKLMFNLLEECKGINERIIRKKIKEEFVKEMKQFIQQYKIKTLSNVYKLDNGKVLSNEVDVMYVMQGTLCIVECKDVSFRFTPNGYVTDMMKVYEFVRKMHKKIESVKQNIQYFETVFDQTIKNVEGILVYRTANFVTEVMNHDKEIQIVSASQFKNTFIQVLKNLTLR